MELIPFAKGQRGLVYLSKYKGKTIAVKIWNPQAKIDRLALEAEFLIKLNKLGIGPKFYFHKEGKVGMEYLRGMRFEKYITTHPKEKILRVVSNLLSQMATLDRIGLIKEEMHHPHKHIIMRNDTPVLIDFERCRYTQKAHNVPQFLQYISSGRLRELFGLHRIVFQKDTCIALAKTYAVDKDLGPVLKSLGLKEHSFDEQVWALCRKIPKGKVTTYKEIAHAMKTKAYRRVGQALKLNPDIPKTPCHRVVCSDGSLGGYCGEMGSRKKIALLKKEGIEVQVGKIVRFPENLFSFV